MKENILQALRKFVRQRPGLEAGLFNDLAGYRAELRGITRDLADAKKLLSAIEHCSIQAPALIDAFGDAYAGRLSIAINGDEGTVTLDYTTGQFWPTEYRRAVCAVCAQALWKHYRSVYPVDSGVWLRQQFREMFGPGIQKRWFH